MRILLKALLNLGGGRKFAITLGHQLGKSLIKDSGIPVVFIPYPASQHVEISLGTTGRKVRHPECLTGCNCEENLVVSSGMSLSTAQNLMGAVGTAETATDREDMIWCLRAIIASHEAVHADDLSASNTSKHSASHYWLTGIATQQNIELQDIAFRLTREVIADLGMLLIMASRLEQTEAVTALVEYVRHFRERERRPDHATARYFEGFLASPGFSQNRSCGASMTPRRARETVMHFLSVNPQNLLGHIAEISLSPCPPQKKQQTAPSCHIPAPAG